MIARTIFESFMLVPSVWPSLIDGERAGKLSRPILRRDVLCVTYAETEQPQVLVNATSLACRVARVWVG